MPATAYDTEQFLSDLGPAEVTFNGVVWGKTPDNEDGGTHGGILVRYETSEVETMRDAEGANAHDAIFVGQKFEIEANLAGMSLEQLKEIFPNAEIVGSGTSRKLVIKNPVGMSQRANAKVLLIKPIIDGEPTTDRTKWMRFPLAHPRAAFEVPFDLENQKVTKVIFRVFHNLTTNVVSEWSYYTA